MNTNENNQDQYSESDNLSEEVDSLSDSSDSSSESEGDNEIVNPNDELTVITNASNQKVLVKKRKISDISKNRSNDVNDDIIEEFKGSVIPYSANLRVMIKQFEDDVPVLDELHKKFADQLYRLRTEEANLEKQLEKEIEKENQDS